MSVEEKIIELDKDKYKNKASSCESILKDFYGDGWKIYRIDRRERYIFPIMKGLLYLITILLDGYIYRDEKEEDIFPCYLVVKGDTKQLIKIKDWSLVIVELPSKINEKKFCWKRNKYRMLYEVDLEKK